MPAGARALAASGWRLEKFDLHYHRLVHYHRLGADGIAALIASPTFAIRRLELVRCGVNMASLLDLVNAPWPLEELDLSENLGDADGPRSRRSRGTCACASWTSAIAN